MGLRKILSKNLTERALSLLRRRRLSFMPNYYYSYEATSELRGFGLAVDEAYVASANRAAIILAIISFALLLFTAIAIKRGRVFGIITAVIQPISIFAATKTVLSFAAIDFSSLEITVTGSSKADAMDKLENMLADAMIEEIFPQMVPLIGWATLLVMTIVVTFIYFLVISKAKLKGLAIVSVIFTGIRFFMCPIEFIGLVSSSATQAVQSGWDVAYRFVFLLPAILVAIQGIVNLIESKKAAPVAVPAPASEAPAAEAPAAEAPVAEAPVAEAPAAEEAAAAPEADSTQETL